MATLTLRRLWPGRQQATGATAAAPPGAGGRRVLAGPLLGLALIVAATAALIGLVRVAGRERVAPGPRYRVETVSRGPVSGTLRVPAWIEAAATVRVGSQVGGRLASVSVSSGEPVRRGQVLARFEDDEPRAAAAGARAQTAISLAGVRQAKLQLGQLVHVLEHLDGLPQGMAPPELAEIQLAAIAAEAELAGAVAQMRKDGAVARAAQTQLARTVLRAPLDGVVAARLVEPGETVAPSPPSPPLFVIVADPRRLRLIAPVGEADIPRLDRAREGATAFETPAFPGRIFRASLVRTEPVAVSMAQGDQEALRYRALLDVDNTDGALRPGMTATVSFRVGGAPDGLRVPVEAIDLATPGPAGDVRIPTAATVWVLDPMGRPARLPVEVGVTNGCFAEVRSPTLHEGARVLLGVTEP